MTKIIGNFLYHFKRILIENQGREKFNEILKGTDEKTRELFSGIIISGEWYDLGKFTELLAASTKKLGRKEVDGITYELAKKQLGGIFGFFIQFASPEKVIRQAQKLWDKVYSCGKITITTTGEKIHIVVQDFEFTNEHLDLTAVYFKGLAESLWKDKKIEMRYDKKGVRMYEFDYDLK